MGFRHATKPIRLDNSENTVEVKWQFYNTAWLRFCFAAPCGSGRVNVSKHTKGIESMHNQTPPPTLRDIVRAIESARKVTLAK